MNKHAILTRMLGTAALAAMFATGSAYAQSAPNAAGQTPANQAGKMSPSGQNETSSVKPSTSGASSSDSAGASSGSQASGKVSSSDKKLMEELAQANMAEIQAGQMALEKSKDDKVRSFAQKMVDDHTKAGDQLKQLAEAKGVTLPTKTDTKHQAEIKKLSALSGDKFDQKYMSQGGVTDHRKTHALLGRIEKQAKDSDLKTLAANLMPTINDHWQMAKDIHGSKSTSTGASGTKGKSSSGAGASSGGGQSGSSSSGTGTSTGK